MNRETQFYQFLQQNRIRLAELRSDIDYARAVIYVNSAVEAADQFEVPISGVSKVRLQNVNLTEQEKHLVTAHLFQLEQFVTELHSRNIFSIDGSLRRDFVSLDEDWRARATTYLDHIRKCVQEAEVEQLLRENILKKLNNLQAEIDRSRAHIHSFSEVFLVLTNAVSEGAKKLDPAVKIVERIAGAIYGLQKIENEEQKKSLPPPERLGLPEPETNDGTKKSDSPGSS
ncbi:hypothetical protein [uncultured Ruegeria sp.]|uniref:hypothetical protein n=1 Tax=uncultured Ruegeria sp. TaxID=259304 RepID=UPI00262528FE|nr:hypothetical protein [uncultured Ruegeria sp.]